MGWKNISHYFIFREIKIYLKDFKYIKWEDHDQGLDLQGENEKEVDLLVTEIQETAIVIVTEIVIVGETGIEIGVTKQTNMAEMPPTGRHCEGQCVGEYYQVCRKGSRCRVWDPDRRK